MAARRPLVVVSGKVSELPTADDLIVPAGLLVDGKIGLGASGSPNYGTDGQVLTSKGAAADPIWTTPSGGGGGSWTTVENPADPTTLTVGNINTHYIKNNGAYSVINLPLLSTLAVGDSFQFSTHGYGSAFLIYRQGSDLIHKDDIRYNETTVQTNAGGTLLICKVSATHYSVLVFENVTKEFHQVSIFGQLYLNSDASFSIDNRMRTGQVLASITSNPNPSWDEKVRYAPASEGYCRRERVEALGNGTVLQTTGGAALTVVGTATARNVATTTMLTRARRCGYVSAAGAGSLAGLYSTVAQHTLIDNTVAGLGFSMQCVFAVSDVSAVSGARMFVGMSSSVAAPTNVDPGAMRNCIGICQTAADSDNLYFVFGDGTTTTLGYAPLLIRNAAGVNGGNLFLLEISQNIYSNQLSLSCVNLFTGAGAVSYPTVGSDTLPSANTLLAFRAWRCNNATASAVGLDFGHMVIDQTICLSHLPEP